VQKEEVFKIKILEIMFHLFKLMLQSIPGNSGGPLFDLDGKVVGINSQIYSRSGGYQGLAFAIPIDVAMEVANQIIEDGSCMLEDILVSELVKLTMTLLRRLAWRNPMAL
jgi:hypothetical protein